MNNKEDDENMEKKLKEFFSHLVKTLEVHAAALEELYSNQRALLDSMQQIGDMNEKLMQAMMRSDNIDIN